MADAAVEFLLGNLKQLLVYNIHLISDLKDEIGSLCNELRMLAAFVKDASEKQTKHSTVKVLVRQIRVAVYEAEDVIDAFVVHAAVQKARSHIAKVFRIMDSTKKLRSVAIDLKSIRKNVKELYDNKMFGFEVLQVGESSNSNGLNRKKPSVGVEENMVGFEAEVKMIVDQLDAPTNKLQVISVVGMGGLGKTTLAKKVFNDASIKYEFFKCAWVHVSQVYTRKEIFLGVLHSIISKVTVEMSSMSEDMLAEELRRQLEVGRYLIVLDDVWTAVAWDDLKEAFPNVNNRSRIILTSRNREVALHASPGSDEPLQLRFLTDDESLELLWKKVFGKGSHPLELEVLGKQISKKCCGLPLAIVVIAGVLQKKDKTVSYWEQVAESVSSYVTMDPEKCMDVLALSYNHLPYDLRACFLYFGVFPEDFEIPVRKLIHIWVAEGFIQQVGDICLEDIAEENLMDLVDRNLILVEKRGSNGRIKTCRIHDMLRELCLKEAEEENFFQEIKGFAPVPSSAATSTIFRRLCVHFQVLEYISSKPSSPHVRSFLCFSLEERLLTPEHLSFIPGAFKLLRVLDIRPINFPRFPKDIIQLVHLRYIALLGTFTVIPAATSNLWNLQTLIVATSSRTLEIKADIWKMLHLRHLYTRASSILPSPAANASEGDKNKNTLVSGNLQTISRVSPESCSVNILQRTPNLKKLGVQGKLVTLMEEKDMFSKFDYFAKLEHLQSLKLLNDTFPVPPSECKLPSLPLWYKFPPKLRKLTLADTLLDWKNMSVLGMLQGLEVLKLGDNAFMGERWEPLEGGFVNLKFLQLGKMDLVHWKASAHHFPSLQRVILKYCTRLEVIPSGLGDISALQIMDLYCPTRSAAASARLIQQKQQQKQQQGGVNNGFRLIIFPPDR